MTNLIIPPDWLPSSMIEPLITCALLGPAVLLTLFAVFSFKSALERLDARLDELQSEIRRLSLRLPDAESRTHAPIPPAQTFDDRARRKGVGLRRVEPRVD